MVQQLTNKKQEYFSWAMPQIIIDMDEEGTFANVPSEVKGHGPYRVDIDESGKVACAVNCRCNHRQYRNAYCKHMELMDLYYCQIASLFQLEEADSDPWIGLTDDEKWQAYRYYEMSIGAA